MKEEAKMGWIIFVIVVILHWFVFKNWGILGNLLGVAGIVLAILVGTGRVDIMGFYPQSRYETNCDSTEFNRIREIIKK